jgi:predicted signal transduction protein with EAL and GGDEF domain
LLVEDSRRLDLLELAGLVVAALTMPYHIDHDRCLRVGASVGIAHAPEHGRDAGVLLSRADIALYAAKAAGKGTHRVFEPEMEQRLRDRLRLEDRLRAALDGEPGLTVHYQPIIDLRTRRVTAREALVRWTDPQDGCLAPSDFVPVAEQGGLIEPLGAWVLRQACRDAARWQDGTRVAVNVSPGQLGRGSLLQTVQQALTDSLLAPGRLEIEVTESALLNHVDEGIAELRRVRDLGVRVALDDFGTGFSSLAHLRAFPFDKIKIDGSFVRDAVLRPDCAAVVRAIADLGRRLGVTTVAEGVETLAHLERVIIEGCTEAQGFLFGEPLPNRSINVPVAGSFQQAWVA